MALNKKQKKQLDVAKKKRESLQKQLAAAKAQPDDPADIPRIEGEIEAVQARIDEIQAQK